MMFVKMCTFLDGVLTMTFMFSKQVSVMARCFAVTALVYCVFGFASGIWGALLTPLTALFHISLDSAGFLYVSWAIGTLPGTLLGGTLLDRWGPRRILFLATLITSGGLLGLCWDTFFLQPPQYMMALCFSALTGVGSGIIDSAANGFVSSYFSYRRSIALNLFSLLNPMSIALVSFINAALLRHFQNDTRFSLLFLLLFSLVAFCSVLFFPRSLLNELMEKNKELRREQHPRSSISIAIGGITIIMVVAGINAFLRIWETTYLHLAFAQPLSIAATESGLSSTFGIVGCLVSATLLLRLHPRRMLALCLVVSILGFIALLVNTNALVALVAFALIGAALSATFGPLVALVSIQRGGYAGSFVSLLIFSGLLSSSLCPPLFGFMLTHFGLTQVIVVAVCMMVGALLVLWLFYGEQAVAWRFKAWKDIQVRLTYKRVFLAMMAFIGGIWVVKYHFSILLDAFSLFTLTHVFLFCLAVGLVSINAIVGIGAYIVSSLTRPKRSDQFIPLTPFALSLPAEEVSFPCQGEAHNVRGLYIPCPGATSTILICPGYRRSFSDVLGMCRHLWDAGHTVLAFEYYGHGIPVGTRVTLGYREVDDFLGAVTYAKLRAPSTRLGVLGYSMGAAVSIIGSARTKAIEAVVADSAFSTQWNAVSMAVRRTLRLPLPSWVMRILYHVTDTLLYWFAGYRFKQVEPVREIANIAPRPILIIHGVLDTIVNPHDATFLYEAAATPKELWMIPGTEHIRGYFADSVKYTEKIITFFETHLKGQPVVNTSGYALTGKQQPLGSHTSTVFDIQPRQQAADFVENVGLSYRTASDFMRKVPLQKTSTLIREKGQRTMVQTKVLQQGNVPQTSGRKSRADEIRRRRFMRILRLRYAHIVADTTHTIHTFGMRYGRLLFRYRWFVLVAWLLAFAISIPFANSVTTLLHNSGYAIQGSDSDHANTVLTDALHRPVSQLLVLFQSDSLPASTSQYQHEVQHFLTRIQTFPHVVNATSGGIGQDGRTTFVTVGFDTDQDAVAQQLPALRMLLPSGGNPVHATITGEPAITNEIQIDTQTDSEHAELLALPLTLLVLLLVFGSVVAGLMPLLLAAVAVPVTLAIVYAVAIHVETNIFVVNVASLIGLGLSIDYSLFIVRRFREELTHGRNVCDAIVWTVMTAGEAVLFSGLTVIIGFSGLFFVGIPVMTSFALGGVTVAAIAVLTALTLLPALLCVVGVRINALRLPSFRRTTKQNISLLEQQSKSVKGQQSFWYTWAVVVMRHPLLMIILVITVLVTVGWPALSLNPGLPGASALPVHSEARNALDQLKIQFPNVDADPIFVLVQTPDGTSMLVAQNLQRLQSLNQRIISLPHVKGTTSLVELPKVGLPSFGEQQLFHLYSTGAYRRVPALEQLVSSTTKGNTTLIAVNTDVGVDNRVDQELIDHLRTTSQSRTSSLRVLVGGSRAVNVDFDRVLYGNFIRALLFIVGATYVLLLFMFRSIVLPLKAIIMNMLSIGAAYGALVFVFQQGHFQNALHFTPDGSLDRFIPVLLFCVLFGLSMDYEVFLLSRIKEDWQRTGDNSAAVAHGLKHTGGIITNAALLFMIVSASFMTTSLVVTKELGFGISIALFVDASLIRTVLVPATMQIMGRTNWWFPRLRKERRVSKIPMQEVSIHVKRQEGRVFITRATDNLHAGKRKVSVMNDGVYNKNIRVQGEKQVLVKEQSYPLYPENWSWTISSMNDSQKPYFYSSYQDYTHSMYFSLGETDVLPQNSSEEQREDDSLLVNS